MTRVAFFDDGYRAANRRFRRYMTDGLEIKMIKETEKELFFDVSYCGYAEIYEKLGVKKLGCTLSCIRDFYFLEGFNPRITLKRTKTIMEGDDYCNFRYVEE
ncbi:unnamed protein product [marine sediment metagenome]|uniref:L-2-amino-thiazoline-4-carboxylic acid hydrolase n=1 Tax=marine sediment metagenome TaxID=412755 RepID=X1B2N7_9ZZZZ